ncbi:MAG: hypothetical protein AB7U73_01915 [Pirellulales bacterium]
MDRREMLSAVAGAVAGVTGAGTPTTEILSVAPDEEALCLVLSFPGTLSREAREYLRRDVSERFKGRLDIPVFVLQQGLKMELLKRPLLTDEQVAQLRDEWRKVHGG